MPSRRDFLIRGLAAGVLMTINVPVFARNGARHVKGATAITQVFGDGIRLIGVAVEYSAPINGADLSAASFHIAGRTVTGAFAGTAADIGARAAQGRFVIITLSPEDQNAPLAEKIQPQGGEQKAPAGSGGKGPGKAGDIPVYDTVYKTAVASVVQSGPITLSDGQVIAADSQPLQTTQVKNPIVDDFQQLEFHDPQTGKSLRYNLFIPKNDDAGESYPLVLFMHDAGATSDVTRTTLYQGLGAIAWASPADQARRPCFVLAPQYAEIIADDDSHTSAMLDTTINLIRSLTDQYRIDRNRLYTTGQSGGCMMSIAMDIRYPTFFAASLLVAGQWDAALTKPLARQKLWIVVSQDDAKAWPGQDAITAVLEKEGAKISRAVWDGNWTAEQFRAAFDKIDVANSPINYIALRKGTVIPEHQSAEGASGHRNTWRIAYTIEPIREWIFRQQR
ncbi:peptidase [Affinibrenneria salicis]|uniref:Peptidase n=1 Tax=Affinibrenneria salicis TaxID=2590031 RepID=A0A5J5G532_9GAMM|nr:PHB depolymerase family esterase [Affinibrenneria salicis]KAA9001334.1 peptidase [Affinibrenneria salicis]